ncbi:AAA-ATPase At2g18193-like [Andrographis paniculata]|uniref:AAA-ATPase At2g18193-like n=1 Tax=Andrographis paniculata TaxID=175694 RepID=UPI0021E7E150|nr:AAA-ATPase At2g18193-like [Andrographis paniculata]
MGEMQSMAGNIFSAYASMAASMMLFRSIARDIIPEPLKSFLYSALSRLFGAMSSARMTMVVDEQSGFSRNQIYDAAEVYLRTKINPDSDRLKVNKTRKQKSIVVSMEKDQQVIDHHNGTRLTWQYVIVDPEKDNNNNNNSNMRRFPGAGERRYFELTFNKADRDLVVSDYLPFVLAKAKEIKEKERAVKLFTRDCPFDDNDDDDGGNGGCGYWGCINLDHPVTFEKLAMDPTLKQGIIQDLERFLRRKDYYKKVGKAWKRGYLLYGPPGTGKSSLVAAMANYLRFDVYDLELSSVYDNSELRRMLLCTNNRSIIVIEDVDCSAQMHDRDKDKDSNSTSDDDDIPNTKLTLSGVLNFIDGLWSSCGDERIIIFTTNHKEKLDPALLRPGRMDMHIHMGYCTPAGFDILAFNYLGISDHPEFFPKIKKLIGEVEITPAEVAEYLMRNDDSILALQGVVDLLLQKKSEQNNQQMLQQHQKEEEEEKEKDHTVSSNMVMMNATANINTNNDGDGNVKRRKYKYSGKFDKIIARLKKLRVQTKLDCN